MSQMDNKPSQQGPGMNININNIGMASGIPGGTDGGLPPRVVGNTEKQILNTYIYDYFIKNDMLECAKAILKNPQADVQHDGNFRNSPSGRPKHEGEMNGVDDDNMDSGDRQGDDGDEPRSVKDLPQPKVPSLHGSSFLLEWWCCFTDIYWARNKSPNASAPANQYVNNTQAQQRLRNESLMRLNPQQTMIGNMQYQNRIGMGVPNGVMHGGQEQINGPGDLAHKQGQPLQRSAVLQRLQNQRGVPQQMANRPQMMPQGPRGEGEVNEMNGQQARPPSTAPAAGSPGNGNKRVRLENGQYEQLGNGRGGAPQGGPPGNATNNAATAHQLLIANGINPDQMTPAQFATFQGQTPLIQQRSIQVYAQNMAAATGKNISALQGPKMSQNPQAGSPMMPQTSEGALGGNGMPEFYAGGPQGMRAGGGIGAGTGNHALQDYQMQLMLLEQQNKKRLMMARAEQDSISSGHNDTNRPGSYAQGMSPGSRAAPSPGPGGKPNMVGTPKMNQVGPGSPLPEGPMPGHVQQRSSPAAGAQFNGGQMSENQHQQSMMYQKQMEMMNANPGAVPNGMMRPPNFNGQMGHEGMPGQMNPNMRAQAGRGGPGMWQHPQMQQPGQPGQQPIQQPQQQPGGPQQGQPPQVGTPQQRQPNLSHTMPPPQAPPNVPNTGRPTPASPQIPNQQPPTPTQSNKPAPKKAARETKQKTKKGAVPQTQPPNAVTPTATSEPPTPTTPQHSGPTFNPRPPNFSGTSNPSNNPSLGQPQQPPNSGPAAPPVVDSTTDSFDFGVDGSTFGIAGTDPDLGLDHFDFDSFLNTGEDTGIAFGGETLQWAETLESGATDA